MSDIIAILSSDSSDSDDSVKLVNTVSDSDDEVMMIQCESSVTQQSTGHTQRTISFPYATQFPEIPSTLQSYSDLRTWFRELRKANVTFLPLHRVHLITRPVLPPISARRMRAPCSCQFTDESLVLEVAEEDNVNCKYHIQIFYPICLIYICNYLSHRSSMDCIGKATKRL